MSNPEREDRHIRERLRAYLLDTLSDAERADLQLCLAASEDLRARLETERDALATLGTLPDSAPRHDLTARVMKEIRARDAEKHRERHTRSRRFFAYAGALAAVLIVSVALLPVLARSREASLRASSANNLRQLGLIMKLYANESKGELFPPLASQEGVWGIDVRVLYPEFLHDPQILIDPGHPRVEELRRDMDAAMAAEPIDWDMVNRIAAESYTYIGWSATSAEALARLKEAQPQRLEGEMHLARDLEDAYSIYRLREGIERFYIADINNPAASIHVQSEIPVMFETRASRPGGRNVLYMDGRVEFVRYGEAFPATTETDNILGIEQD